MPLSDNAKTSKDARAGIPEMQHRHFAYIARIIADMDLPWQSRDMFQTSKETMANHFARELAKSNPRFDSARFLKACRGF